MDHQTKQNQIRKADKRVNSGAQVPNAECDHQKSFGNDQLSVGAAKCEAEVVTSIDVSEDDFYFVPNNVPKKVQQSKNVKKEEPLPIHKKKNKKKSQAQTCKGLPSDVRVPYIYKPNLTTLQPKSPEVKAKKVKRKVAKELPKSVENISKDVNVSSIKRFYNMLNPVEGKGPLPDDKNQDKTQIPNSETHSLQEDVAGFDVNLVTSEQFTLTESKVSLDVTDPIAGSEDTVHHVLPVHNLTLSDHPNLEMEPLHKKSRKRKNASAKKPVGSELDSQGQDHSTVICVTQNQGTDVDVDNIPFLEFGEVFSEKDTSNLLTVARENGIVEDDCSYGLLDGVSNTTAAIAGALDNNIMCEVIEAPSEPNGSVECSALTLPPTTFHSDVSLSDFEIKKHILGFLHTYSVDINTSQQPSSVCVEADSNEKKDAGDKAVSEGSGNAETCDENKNIIKTCDKEECLSDISGKADCNDTDNESITSISEQDGGEDEWEDISSDSSGLNEEEAKSQTSAGDQLSEATLTNNHHCGQPLDTEGYSIGPESPSNFELNSHEVIPHLLCNEGIEVEGSSLGDCAEEMRMRNDSSEALVKLDSLSEANEHFYICYLTEFRKNHPQVVFVNNRLPSPGCGLVPTCYGGDALGEDLILLEESLQLHFYRYQKTFSFELPFSYVVTLGRHMARQLPINVDEVVVTAFAEVLISKEFRKNISCQYAQTEFINAVHALMSDRGREYGLPGEEQFEAYMQIFTETNPNVVMKSPFESEYYNDVEALFHYAIFVATSKSYCSYTRFDLKFMCVALIEREGYVPDTLMIELVEELNTLGYIVQITNQQIGMYSQRYAHTTMVATILKKLECIDKFDVSASHLLRGMPNTHLTCFMAIGRAIRYFNDFTWGNLMLVCKKEWHNYTLAVITLNGMVSISKPCLYTSNYNNYPQLAYTAKQILVSIGNETLLQFYPGWADLNVKHKKEIDTLVDNYKKYKMNGAELTHEKLTVREEREKDFLINLINGYVYRNVLDPMDIDCSFISFIPSSMDSEEKEKEWFQLLRSRLVLKLRYYGCPQ